MTKMQHIEDQEFHHLPVMLEEAVDALQIRPEGTYVDATFGGGGHSKAILDRLGAQGKLIAFDHDADAWQNALQDKRFTLVQENFRYLHHFLDYLAVLPVDGILADLGVSSHQFDTADRGFSIRFDAPLDMRMDQRLERNAVDILNKYSVQELQRIFEQFGQVRNSRTLANLIAERRSHTPLRTVSEFKKMLEPLTRGNPNKYLAQVFQAIRIEVNEELDALEDFLQAAAKSLKPGGILAVITFHSLEDRMVKQFIKQGSNRNEETDVFGRSLVKPVFRAIADLVPSEEELKINNRSRSARLRSAQRIQDEY